MEVPNVRVAAAFRYPVKSMQGEPVDRLSLGPDGVDGDRTWGVREQATGIVLTGKRFGALMTASARAVDGRVDVRVPDGEWLEAGDPAADTAVSDLLGRAVQLVRAEPGERADYFTPPGIDEDEAPIPWQSPPGRFVDGHPLLVLTTASLAAGAGLHPDGVWDVRRFRPNLLLEVDGEAEGFVEDGWVGGSLAAGDAVLTVRKRCTRCVMVLRAQPGLPRDPDLARALQRHRDTKLGVYAGVERPGVVAVGDTVAVASAA